MKRYVAFLRGVNIAGHASMKMSDARDAFAAAGGRNVRTFIQSGNVVFESPARVVTTILRQVRDRLRGLADQAPEILLRTVDEIDALVARDPFKDVERGPGIKLYVAFLFKRPGRRPAFPFISIEEALEAVAMTDREVFVVSRRKENGFFGIPNLFVEKALGVSATSRNWSTISGIVRSARIET